MLLKCTLSFYLESFNEKWYRITESFTTDVFPILPTLHTSPTSYRV